MISIANTVIPIFLIILLGWFLRSRRFITAEILGPLNRLVYYMAIPAMIFRSLANASFSAFFNPALLAATLGPILIVFFLALVSGLLFSIKRELMGTFVQSSFHGNLGYIGFAVCYYLLGEDGLTRASILAGFMMCLQNLLAVLVLQFFSGEGDISKSPWFFIRKILGNPVILSAVAGILFSLLEIPIGATVDRSLEILSNMALPLALLVIGSSISLDLVRSNIRISLLAGIFKLLCFLESACSLFTLRNPIGTAYPGSDPVGLSNRNHHLYHGGRDGRIHQPGIFSRLTEHAPFRLEFLLLAWSAHMKQLP